MTRASACTFVFCLFSCGLFAAATPLDYWEKSPALWKKITLERGIVVSAKNEEGRTHSKGAGLVKAPVSALWAFATDADKIKKSSRFLESFSWDKKTGHVEMRIKLLAVDYLLKGKASEEPDPENPKLHLEVHEGSIVPFTTTLEMRSSKAQSQRPGAPLFAENHTLVVLNGISSKDRSLSWPLRVALEAVLQRTAGALRSAVEAEIAEASLKASR